MGVALATIGAALASLVPLTPGAVAAPPNDNFADAKELVGLPAEATGSSVDATVEPDEPIGGAEHSIWFKWTAPTDGGVTFTTGGCAPPFQDSTLVSGTYFVFAKSAVFGLVPLQPTFHARAGQVYWFAVASSQNQPGDPDICVRLLPGPANDDFALATPLTGFPVSATQTRQIDSSPATQEPGEPAGSGSVWYSWTAPAGGPVWLRICGGSSETGPGFEQLAVYTGDRVDALAHVATRRGRDGQCGSLRGAAVLLAAVEGQVYRIAVTTPVSFQLLVGNQLAVAGGEQPFLVYNAFPRLSDTVKLRLSGSGARRALLLKADRVTVANGCQADLAPGTLRCPVPGKATVSFDIDLGDQDDSADVRLLGPAVPSQDGQLHRQVVGGAGNDTLVGSAGSYSPANGWSGGLALLGGPGADTLGGREGDDQIFGGPGPDQIEPGAGSDRIDGGPGDDRVRTIDGATDTIRCQAGRDRTRIDGVDLPAPKCERRNLRSPARAVATFAALDNDNGDDADHLEITIACPIDAKRDCRATITAAVPRGVTFTRRLRLHAGRFGDVETYRFGDDDRLLRYGTRVTVSTRRPGRPKLNFTRHLPVYNNRYEGE
jgi:hypothetical protein